MLELEVALQKILAALPTTAIERVSLCEASQRVLAEPICSPIELPPFDNSAMDGYAVRAVDVVTASSNAPICLRLIGRVAAGESFIGKLAEGDCVRVFTGSALPTNADAVVMQEDTRTSTHDHIQILESVRQGENLRRQGEDVVKGAMLAEAGDVLTPGRIALLAATGANEVVAARRPMVALLATGSELRESSADSGLAPGQIFESNRLALAPLARGIGGVTKIFPLVPDTLAATQAALEHAFAECNVVITSGGVSVGEMDFVKAAFERLGGELQFWKVAIRPGKPFVFGRHGEKFLFGLPGNPVSALVTFLLLVRPALLRWQGVRDVALPSHTGVLAEPLANPGDRRHFMRVRVDPSGKIFSAGRQASHALASLAAANGVVDVPAQTTLVAGSTVTVMRWY